MKKILATLAAVATVAVCSATAFAVEVGESEAVPGASSGESNVPTGVVLTVVPAALAAGALTVSGIVLKKKNK